MNIYIICTPNLGLEIAILGLEREQGRFKESIEGARARSGGALGKHEGSIEVARGEHYRAVQGRSRREPEIMGFLRLGLSCSRCFAAA